MLYVIYLLYDKVHSTIKLELNFNNSSNFVTCSPYTEKKKDRMYNSKTFYSY